MIFMASIHSICHSGNPCTALVNNDEAGGLSGIFQVRNATETKSALAVAQPFGKLQEFAATAYLIRDIGYSWKIPDIPQSFCTAIYQFCMGFRDDFRAFRLCHTYQEYSVTRKTAPLSVSNDGVPNYSKF